ncbi:hypothetical protein [Pseudonocardia acaciae]|uniref:hypothetical protein n=1 Tax=Pseudonocardia acaciae TaxID=551276 RepID=UPI00048AB7DF|nr:hypothetical protein [Pseudonocardia acaciae]
MSKFRSVLSALRRLPRGASADGRSIGLGLAAALDAQRARGAEPITKSPRPTLEDTRTQVH